MALERSAASTAKSGLDLRPNPPPSSVTFTVTSSGDMPSRFATRSRVACGDCTHPQTSHLPLVMRTVAAGGAIGDGVVARVGAVVPRELERLASLDGRPGVGGDNAHPAQRIELGRARG